MGHFVRSKQAGHLQHQLGSANSTTELCHGQLLPWGQGMDPWGIQEMWLVLLPLLWQGPCREAGLALSRAARLPQGQGDPWSNTPLCCASSCKGKIPKALLPG